MKHRNDKGLSAADTSMCKVIYKRFWLTLTEMGIPRDKLNELLSNDDFSRAELEFERIIANDRIIGAKTLKIQRTCGIEMPTTLFEHLYFYRRNLHLMVDDAFNKLPDVNIKDLTLFNKVNRDMCIDITYNERQFAVYVYHRTFPIRDKSKKLNLDWTIQVFGYLPKIMDLNKSALFLNAMRPLYTFHLEASNDTKRVYIEPGPRQSFCRETCDRCNRCNATYKSRSLTGDELILLNHSLVYKDKSNCHLFIDLHAPAPVDLLKYIVHALECYTCRETLTRKNGKKTAAYNQCKVHTAKDMDSKGDTIVMLPLHEYVAEYRESHPSEYKGGHHASPVTHERRGYFRKARKHGNYIRNGNEFIRVEDGKGTYCFVRATTVNRKTDNVIIYKTSSEDA